MNPQQQLFVSHAGIVCPVGDTPEMVCAAVNAGVATLADSFVLGKHSTPFRMATVPNDALEPLDSGIDGSILNAKQQRIITLAGKALQSVLTAVKPTSPPPVFIALPESLPRIPSLLPKNLIALLAQQSGQTIDEGASQSFPLGRCGGLVAVTQALQYLSQKPDAQVLVGGVDTCMDLRKLAFLDAHDRIKTQTAMHGFFPGEGATFLLLSATPLSRNLGSVSRPGLSAEPAHFYSDTPTLGDAFSNATREALAQGSAPIELLYSSHNGEPFFSKELGIALTRNSTRLASEYEHIHPAEFFGDLGAAMAPTLLMLALDSRRPSLVMTASDLEQRAAICVN